MNDLRIRAPAVSRNRDAILDVLRAVLPRSGTVLEIASGTGEHVVHFARHLPDLTFQPTDASSDSLPSIAAWIEAAELTNVHAPRVLDAAAQPWPVTQADAVVCINMVHISPWRATAGLIEGAARLLQPSAPLYLYGPYRRDGAHTAPSNEAFDLSLKARDPSWGLRDMADVASLAHSAGFGPPDIVPMPANNFSLIFRRC